MKIKAYDKYNEQWIILSFPDDNLKDCFSYTNSNGAWYSGIHMKVEAINGDKDSCEPERWSDLENFKII